MFYLIFELNICSHLAFWVRNVSSYRPDAGDDVYYDDDDVDNNNHLPGAHVFTSFLECVTSSSLQLNHLLI